MIDQEILRAFEIDSPYSITPLKTGLINNSFHIEYNTGKNVLIQQINERIFLNPLDIQTNYQMIMDHLLKKGGYKIPPIILTKKNELLLKYQNQYWRCFQFYKNSYSPLVASYADEAYTVAACFGKYSADLSDLKTKDITYILPGFHNLAMRFQQLESTLDNCSKQRKQLAKELIESAYENIELIHHFNTINNSIQQYPLHILHQDCKIANILFTKDTNEIICPIDLDTTQPGLFFSDLGDMIRSMVPNISENDTNISDMEIRKDFLDAIKDGYLSAMSSVFTKEELAMIDKSGLIIIYMQALRYLTDFLNNDKYYKTEYDLQNLDRSKNQFNLLKLLRQYQRNIQLTKIYS